MTPGRRRFLTLLAILLPLVVLASVAAALLEDAFGSQWWLNIIRAIPIGFGAAIFVHLEERRRRD